MKRIQINHFKKFTKTSIVIACALVLSAVPVTATSIEDAQDERDEASQNKDEAQDILDSLESQISELYDDVESLDAQVSAIQTQITQKEEEEEQLNEEIEDTTNKLAEAQVEEDDQYASMINRIQYLYENGDVEYIDTLLSSASFTDMLNKSEYIEQLSSYDQEQLNSLIQVRTEIQEYEETLEADLAEVEKVQQELENQQASLESVISEKQALISKYEDDAAAQEALVQKYQDEMDELDEKIAAMQAAQSSSSSGSTSYYDTSLSGQFAWPAPGHTSISSYFGPRTSPTAGASSNHKGIDIPCPTGSDIIASASGTVTISQYSSSAGYYIMIDHGNGVSTVYMHNSQLLVGVGTKVTQGQVIAKAGSTGYSTGSHCHFGIMINGTYVNPLDYL